MTIDNAQLLQLNHTGWIPGPNEKEEDFVRRVACGQSLKDKLPTILQNLGMREGVKISNVGEKAGCLSSFYDVSLDEMSIIYSNAQLAPWQGACTWIVKESPQDPLIAFIQLGHATEEKTHECLIHELVHVGRMAFEEPKFEEMLAYQTSPSSFKQWLGPIIQAAWEGYLWVFSLIFSLFIDILCLFFPESFSMSIFFWGILPFLILIIAALIRLALRHSQFNRCLKKLNDIVGETKSYAVIYRLTDREIIAFGSMNTKDILHYSNTRSCLRWKVILSAYFFH